MKTEVRRSIILCVTLRELCVTLRNFLISYYGELRKGIAEFRREK